MNTLGDNVHIGKGSDNKTAHFWCASGLLNVLPAGQLYPPYLTPADHVQHMILSILTP